MGHFVPARLALLGRAAELPEGLKEKRLDVVGLEPPCFGTFHVLAHAPHAARVHRVVSERPLLQQILQLGAVEGACDDLCEPGAHLRQLAVADRFDQEVAERLAFELNLAQHVEHLPAERRAGLVELLE